MRRLITFCVLLLFSALAESIPFPSESLEEHPKEHGLAHANTLSSFAQPQKLHHNDVGSSITNSASARALSSNLPITKGSTVVEIQKKIQEQRPVIKETIDNKIQPHYTSVEPREIKLNSVPEIRNVDPLRQAHHSVELPLRNLPESTRSESSATSAIASTIKIEKQIEKTAEVLALTEAEIALAAAETNLKEAVVTAKEQIAHAITKPKTNIDTPPKQNQYANLPPNFNEFKELLQSNPKLKDVISSRKNKKRYIVVHPDGRVEHVDNIEPIVQEHPDHVLVKAATLRDHMSRINPVTKPIVTTITNPLPVPIPAPPKAAPAASTAASSAAAVTSAGPISKGQLEPHITHEPVNTVSTVSTAIETPATSSSTNTSTTSTVKIAVTATPSLSSTAVVAPVNPVPTPCAVTDYPISSTLVDTKNNLHALTVAATTSAIPPSAVTKPISNSVSLPPRANSNADSSSLVVHPPAVPKPTPIPCLTTSTVDVPAIPIPPKIETSSQSASFTSVTLPPHATSKADSSSSIVPPPVVTKPIPIPVSLPPHATSKADSSSTIVPPPVVIKPIPIPVSLPPHATSKADSSSSIVPSPVVTQPTPTPCQTISIVEVPALSIPPKIATSSQSASFTSVTLPPHATSKADSSSSIVPPPIVTKPEHISVSLPPHATSKADSSSSVGHPSAVPKPTYTPYGTTSINDVPAKPIPPKSATSSQSGSFTSVSLPHSTAKAESFSSAVSKSTPSSTTHVNTLTSSVLPVITSKASDISTSSTTASSSSTATPCKTTSIYDIPAKPIDSPKFTTTTQSTSCASSQATSKSSSYTSNANLDTSAFTEVSEESDVTRSQIFADSYNTEEPCSITADESSLHDSSCAAAETSVEDLFEDCDDITDFEHDHHHEEVNQSNFKPAIIKPENNKNEPCPVTVNESSIHESSRAAAEASAEDLSEDCDDITDCEHDHHHEKVIQSNLKSAIIKPENNENEPCPVTVNESSIHDSSRAAAEASAEDLSEDCDDITDCEHDNHHEEVIHSKPKSSTTKPVIWYEITGLDYWDKLLEEQPYSLVYFYNAPSQPILKKDTRTTVHN